MKKRIKLTSNGLKLKSFVIPIPNSKIATVKGLGTDQAETDETIARTVIVTQPYPLGMCNTTRTAGDTIACSF